MHFLIDFGALLHEPPRNIKTIAVKLIDELKWAYLLTRNKIEHKIHTAENRYTKRFVTKLYNPKALEWVIQHIH